MSKLMVLKNFYLTQEQETFLESLDGSVSGHIRRAIDDYIHLMKSQAVSTSKSKITKGGKNG